MSVRAKFKCITVQHNDSGFDNVTFEPRYEEGDDAVNNSWSKYTPSGKLEMCITNPAAVNQFEVGKQYFLDIELAPESEQDAE